MAASDEDEEEEAALFIKPTILNPETRVRLPTMNTFARSVQRLSDRTGLTPGQLGIARVFDTPHHNPHATGPLQGMDVLVKDLHQVEGEVTTMGSVHQQFTAPHYDSAAYALLEAGARLVGMSTSAEFGTTAYTEPVGMDHPVNPISPLMMTGGSSGGAAVAVARGLVDVAHATDGGGSIRIPAACVGLPGLKPAHDRTVGHFTPAAQGFIAKDISTTARAYGVELSEDFGADAASAADVTNPARPTPRLRIGYTNQPFHSISRVAPAIAAATAAASALAATHPGVESVSQAPPPYPPAMFDLFSEMLAARCAYLPGELTPLTDWLRKRGRDIPSWRRMRVEDQLLGLNPMEAWSELDVILTPTLACAPPPPGTFSALPPARNFQAQTAWTPWGTLWNITGWAAVSVPLVDPARVPGRWPISLMIGAVGSRVSAGELLSLASFISDATSSLPAEGLSLELPGDVEALDYLRKPDNSHKHGHEHGDEHGHDEGAHDHG